MNVHGLSLYPGGGAFSPFGDEYFLPFFIVWAWNMPKYAQLLL